MIDFQIYDIVCPLVATLFCLHRLLSHWPSLIHSKKLLGLRRKHKIIAHRGSRNEDLPENTIAAFKDAVSAGAHVIEFDIWLSRDGQVIVFHDETFSRMTKSCHARVIDLDFSDYPKIHPPAGQSDRCYLYDVQEWGNIPLLIDVLKVIPMSVGINIEFKQDSEELIDKVMTILEPYGKDRLDNMYWFSLEDKINSKLRARKYLPTIVSISSMLKVALFYQIGLLPFLDVEDEVYGMPLFQVSAGIYYVLPNIALYSFKISNDVMML